MFGWSGWLSCNTETIDPVTMSAMVLDKSEVGSTLSAQYRFDGTSTFSGVTLFDDGVHGDVVAEEASCRFGYQLSFEYVGIEFLFSATDDADNVWREVTQLRSTRRDWQLAETHRQERLLVDRH